MPSRNWGHVPSIAEALGELKNSSKGNKLESILSQQLHQVGVPILISAKLLREHNLGQIDICLYHEKMIRLYEVKQETAYLSDIQLKRLIRSLEFLIQTFDAPGKLEVINSLPK